jgi:hypothetical protein
VLAQTTRAEMIAGMSRIFDRVEALAGRPST